MSETRLFLMVTLVYRPEKAAAATVVQQVPYALVNGQAEPGEYPFQPDALPLSAEIYSKMLMAAAAHIRYWSGNELKDDDFYLVVEPHHHKEAA